MTTKKNISGILSNALQTIKTGNKRLAIQFLSDYCTDDSDDANIPREIANFLQKNNMPIKAEMFYQNSLSIDNNQSSIYFNLGVIYQQMDKTEQAIAAYIQATEISPDYAKAYANLGYIYHETGDTEKSKAACLKAQSLDPENPQIKHMIAALGIEPLPETANQQYIKDLYKDYAGHYDEHLSVTLKSKVPELIFNTTLEFMTSKSPTNTLLDLGCGTGICGNLFIDHANKMTGVDLSEEMIEEARKKEIYSQLFVSDLGEYLVKNNDTFDIAISSDVLIYIGNLQEIFDGVYKSLNKNGLFTFSIESSFNSEDDFILDSTGRYKHNPAYIENIAKNSGFTILSSNETELRQQNKKGVIGRIYVVNRA
ncbi:MAG: tetratricopeptide repeat protein [Pseudomonadota bacterium]